MAARDVARIDYQTARNKLIPPEIQIALADMEAEFTLRDAAIALNIEALEKEIKQVVLAHGASVKGAHVHAVWTPKANPGWTGMRAAWIATPLSIQTSLYFAPRANRVSPSAKSERSIMTKEKR